MGIALAWVTALIAGGVGACLGWLLARRGRERALALAELELATARARAQRSDADAEALVFARAAVARAEAEARLLSQRVEQLSSAQAEASSAAARLARAEAELVAAQQRGARAEALEGRLEEVVELAARREAELRAAAERREHLESQLVLLEPMSERVQRLSQLLARAEASLEAERGRGAERALELEKGREAMRHEFEALAQRLLDEKGRTLLDASHRGLEGLLTPVKERLREFEDKFQKTFDQDNRDRASLLEKLRGLQEAQNRLHADADALSRALTGESKSQGDWGELVLESLLSTAGLTEGREYALQVDHRDEDGAHRRPDALVYLPPNRAIVIDSKCSLTAFVASSRTTSDDERERQLALHVQSVRAHVRALSLKDYQSVLAERTLDIVLLFVPNEAAFHAALSRDPSLYEDAFRQRVVLCSPTTLLAALQVVSHVWRSERQTLNAQRIAEEAGKMIDKLAVALESFDELGEKLNRAQLAFDTSRSRLATGRGNVMQLAARVVELGARVSKPEKLEAARARLDAEPESAEDAAQAELALEQIEGELSARRSDGERRGRDHSRDRRRVESDADDEAVPRGEGPAPDGPLVLPPG